MGADRRAAEAQRGGHLKRIAQVVPDVPSFSVDDGFSYEIPAALEHIDVGDLVRIPLGGRRVRGYVTSVSTSTSDRPLRPIAARTGTRGIFTPTMLESLRWAATHYVAPLSTVLGRSAPPNSPRGEPTAHDQDIHVREGALTSWATRQVEEGRTRPAFLLSADPLEDVIGAIAPVVRRGRNVIVGAPTVREAGATAAALREAFGDSVVPATGEDSPAARTRAWIQLSEPTGSVVVGTREVAFWGRAIGLAVLLDEGRRAYKAPGTPTYHVREILRRRSAIERFGLLLTGVVPTSEALASGVEVMRERRRIWPLVDVVDRSGASSADGPVGDRARHAIAALGSGANTFVLVPRRGDTRRCARCRQIRRCPECGSSLDESGSCARCERAYPACTACGGRVFEAIGASVPRIVADLRRSFGPDAGAAGSGARIEVGTERDLVAAGPFDLVVIIEPDTLILAPTYRAEEEALRLLARAAATAKPGRGRRALVVSHLAEHRVMNVLRHGDPMPFMEVVQAERARAGLPPVGELLAIETDAASAHDALEHAAHGATLLGPVAQNGRQRWLVQGADLRSVKVRLRAVVQQLRDGGARVRVDVDPVDL